jgi:hypothetical protein
MLALGIVGVVFPQSGHEKAEAAIQDECVRLPFPDNPSDNFIEGSVTCTTINQKRGVAYYAWNQAKCKYEPKTDPKAYGGFTSGLFLPPDVSKVKVTISRTGKPGECIAKTELLHFSFSSDKKIYMWKWDPSCSCKQKACEGAYNTWQKNILAHERRHVMDIENIVSETNQGQICNVKDAIYQAKGTCNPKDAKSAIANLNRKVQATAKQIIDCMEKEGEKRKEDFHGGKVKGLSPFIPPLKCANCPPAPCLSGATMFPALQSTSCGDMCCGPCQECDINGSCQTKTCPECTTCNPNTGACEPCRACQVCQDGTCVDQCGECSHCGPEGCLPDCTTGEHCCGGQCINLSQYKCCTTLAGSFVCPSNEECCAGSQTCCDPTVEQCCGGACMPYGDSNCRVGACLPCGADQFCCLRADGRPFGCCPNGHNCDPELGCQ